MIPFDILAPMASADGYGYSAEELVKSAHYTHGADIGFITHDWVEKAYTGQALKDLVIPRHLMGRREVLLQYFIPFAFFQNAGVAKFNIGQTMFETTEIPDIWAWCMNQHTNGVIVPSEFNREVFAHKVHVPIEVVPLGVNPQVYPYLEREPSEIFTFVMAGSLHYRKGVEFAIRAFKDEFAKDAPVRLVLKTRKKFFDIGNETLNDRRIQLVDCDYSREDMLNLYHAGDCFIACSRGEASGLTPREAMSTGMPAIVTNWGGLTELADPRYNYLLEIEGLELAPAECSSYDQGITQGQPIGFFCKPSVESLRVQMRTAFEDPAGNSAKGKAASKWITEKWNYDLCAKRWLEAIERIYHHGR